MNCKRYNKHECPKSNSFYWNLSFSTFNHPAWYAAMLEGSVTNVQKEPMPPMVARNITRKKCRPGGLNQVEDGNEMRDKLRRLLKNWTRVRNWWGLAGPVCVNFWDISINWKCSLVLLVLICDKFLGDLLTESLTLLLRKRIANIQLLVEE